jgi:hypothetical protein
MLLKHRSQKCLQKHLNELLKPPKIARNDSIFRKVLKNENSKKQKHTTM